MSTDTKQEVMRELARRLYGELGSGNKVAMRLQITPKAAYKLLREAGVEVPDRYSPEVQDRKKSLHGEDALRAAEDYASGMAMKEICAKYGVGDCAVRTAARDAGYARRPRGGKTRKITDEVADEMVRLYAEGLGQMAIAQQLNCSSPVVSRILRQRGVEIRGNDKTGENHWAWKGGKTISSGGYVSVYLPLDDPLAVMRNRTGYVPEHRLVVARWLGRPLTDQETVHHVNGRTNDNRLENLQLRHGNHGAGVAYVCHDCGSQNVGPGKLKETRAAYRRKPPG